jgi:hypothetical protein
MFNNGCLLCRKCHLLSADEETTSASLIFCLKQAVLKYTQAEEEEDSSRKKVGIISMLKN